MTAGERRFMGVAEAIVTDVDDGEGLGRVRLQLQWLDTHEKTDWCRVAQLHAGPGYGTLWVPEPGDEVLVAWRLGDPEIVYVLGGLYNGKHKPVTARTDKRNEKSFRTKGGHHIVLDDSAEQQRVEVRTKQGSRVLLDDTGQRIEVAGRNGPSISMNLKDGSLVIKAKAITIDATEGALVLKGKQKIALN